MTRKNGFTLVEVMVVVSIVIILLAWGVPSYSTWKRKHDIEGQMLGLYNNLHLARMTAYSQKVVTGVWWGSGAAVASYQVRRDANNNGNINDTGTDTQLGATVTVNYPITASSGLNSVTFDGRGFCSATSITFSVTTTTGAAINCVAVITTRIITGKMNAGACSP